MRFQATITVQRGTKKELECFVAETESAHDKSRVELEKVKGGIKLRISAEDASSLRAQFNSVAKMLNVFDKISSIRA
ncbi:MAG: KEOPS complex subunit Pcc1 [archaeon]